MRYHISMKETVFQWIEIGYTDGGNRFTLKRMYGVVECVHAVEFVVLCI